MKQIITICLGQCGIRIGNQVWKLFCEEHKIELSGIKKQSENTLEQENLLSFFQESVSEKITPISVFIDLDTEQIDEIKNGQCRTLYKPDCLISSKEDTGGLFSRGYYTAGRSILDHSIDQIRKIAESCSYLHGFIIYSTSSGGASSGLGNLILQRLRVDYGQKIPIIFFQQIPCNLNQSSVFSFYNSTLNLGSLLEESSLNILFQNESLYKIYENQFDFEYPSFNDVNRLVSQVASATTSSIRFKGDLNFDLNQLIMNLVPYRKINLVIPSYSPSTDKNNQQNQQMSVNSMTNQLFKNDFSFINCKINANIYMACSYMIRGDIVPREALESIYNLKKKKNIKFVDWCSNSFLLGVNSFKPIPIIIEEKSFSSSVDGCILANSCGVQDAIDFIGTKFDLMYSKRAFVHWHYGEGQSEGDLQEAREILASIEKDYEEISKDSYTLQLEEDYE
ncbi:tubulin/FtsZ family, GTPase domain protein (macronuclear) [Tetrahymena thermophila SB210]|uniref:Tubulin/FtsZ family, GTPase domain protein n=1 Tax=Tetrahymena thermophila (strain SB210) TaxID=312017 RepID=Q23WP5_TETTS|nr:tubulin/FtsZ family, GTPase domain protein [Tetrahymena thermophila SB210]EAS00935.1 tubulin/FtsZ family, GTPase domain protein [Tetrahymena thermophila SB210]|eukprot:XP_001021180.1 tubulin/FtsZ family, GTPase domain protein [Tetrahymena thermophila SB210]